MLQSLLSSISSGLQSTSPPKTIIFVQRKAKAVELYQFLSAVDKHHQVGVHHSRLREETGRQVENEFKEGRLSVVIATIGFGIVGSIEH